MYASSRKSRNRMVTWWILLPMLNHLNFFVSATERRRNYHRIQKGISTAKPRIVGGTPAAPGAYPFHVHALFADYLCGGTLVAPDFVLTAAHCSGSFLEGVLIGGLLLDGSDAFEIIAVESEIPHPYFDEETLLNDIMLVKLARPSISPVVDLNFDPTNPTEGDVLTVIGFGNTMFEGEPSNDLLTVNIDAYPAASCLNLYENFDPATQICAGTAAGGRDSCQGDSGGPLLSVSNRQLGVVSNGGDCGLPDIPAIYARVAAYESFIRAGICDLSDFPPADCDSPTNTLQPTRTVEPTITLQPTIVVTTVLTAEPTVVQPPSVVTAAPTIAPANVVEPTVSPDEPRPDDEPTFGPTSAPTTSSAAPDEPTHDPTMKGTEEPTMLSTVETTNPPSCGKDSDGKGGKGGGMMVGGKSDKSGGMMVGGKSDKSGGMMTGGKSGKGDGMMIHKDHGHDNVGMMIGKGTMKVHYGKGFHINGNVQSNNYDDDDGNNSEKSDLLRLIFGQSW